MKRIFSMVAVLFLTAMVLCAQERVLFDASKLSEATYSSQSVSTDNSADKWYVDFGNSGVAGSAKYTSIIKPSDAGVGVKIEITNKYFDGKQVSAVLRPNILPQLTENESGNGKIVNVGDIKSITIEGTSLSYDIEIGLDLSMSDGTQVGFAPQKTQQLGKNTFTVTWENPNYISDVTKRDIRPKPVYPNTYSELILNGIKVRGNPAYFGGDTGYMFLYVNKITVVADKAYEETDSTLEDLWGIETALNSKYGKIQEAQLEEREILRAQEAALMAEPSKETENSSDAK